MDPNESEIINYVQHQLRSWLHNDIICSKLFMFHSVTINFFLGFCIDSVRLFANNHFPIVRSFRVGVSLCAFFCFSNSYHISNRNVRLKKSLNGLFHIWSIKLLDLNMMRCDEIAFIRQMNPLVLVKPSDGSDLINWPKWEKVVWLKWYEYLSVGSDRVEISCRKIESSVAHKSAAGFEHYT